MGRSPCCSKEELNKGTWTAHEDKILIDYIRVHGEGRWRNVPKRAGLKRCGKSCRLRWLNYLRPDIKRGNISSDEEELIIRLHNLLGNRWSLIAGRLPGRTDNEIKNYWNTNLGKRVKSTSSRGAQPTPKVKVTPSPATKAENVVSNCSLSNPMEPNENNNGFLSFINEEEKNLIPTTDLVKDFKEGDVCLSELLNSDFSDMCDFSYNQELLTPCSDQLPIFSHEILKDWTQSNSASVVETSAPNKLSTFS